MLTDAAKIVANLAITTERRKRAKDALDGAKMLYDRLVREENDAISAFNRCLSTFDIVDSRNHGHDARLIDFWSSVAFSLMQIKKSDHEVESIISTISQIARE